MNETTIQLEGIVLHELARAWNHYALVFKWDKSGIVQPLFKITEAKIGHWAQWVPDSREMHFSGYLVKDRPWTEVLEVLKHEMAHQYVGEVLKVTNETAHGPTFQQVCKQYGIDGHAKGIDDTSLTATNHIVEKIRHLLELAEKNNQPEEQDAAIKAARSMMLKYNIELQAKNEERGYVVRYAGGINGRVQAYMTAISNLLAEYYFVEIIWSSAYDPRTKKRGHELELSGTEENVEAAEFVYDFLSRSALEAWEKKFADPAFKLQLNQEFSRSWGRGSAPATPRGFVVSARSNFLLGFVQGFKSQLKKEEIKEQQAGLILAKDPGLEDFYHTRHPHVRTTKGGGAYYNPGVKNQGFAQGSSLKMPLATKPNKQFTPLLNK